MSRVLSVVDRSIRVHLHDVQPNDILYIMGTERDPIVERVERDGDSVRLHYRDRPQTAVEKELGIEPIKASMWMDPNTTDPNKSGSTFVHDLRNERQEFNDTSVRR